MSLIRQTQQDGEPFYPSLLPKPQILVGIDPI